MQYMIKTKNNDIVHFGTKRHSGRYPYGSGKDPYQHDPIYMHKNMTLNLASFSGKYKNRKTGELTKRGQQRFDKVYINDKLSKSNTETAKKILSKNAKTLETQANTSRRIAETSKNKEISKRYYEAYKNYMMQSNVLNQKLKDIDSGKLKAGKDFITQTNVVALPLILPGFALLAPFVDTKVIER